MENETSNTEQEITWMNEKEASKVAAVSVGTLRRWRCEGTGPPFYKFGRSRNSPIRYKKSDITEWLEQFRNKF